MNIAVYSTIFKEQHTEFIQDVFDALFQSGIEISIYEPYYQEVKNVIQFRSDLQFYNTSQQLKQQRVDIMLTLGGDGTILSVISLVRDSGIPVLGVNLGRLGFLASVEKSKIEQAIYLIAMGQYQTEERTLLYLEADFPIFGNTNFALNDFTILKRDTSSMITIHTYLNGAFLNSYWADGLIVSTPTGSTGYSLSCGGPIVFPSSGCFAITPVAPHNLNVRPIVIPDSSVISFEIEGRSDSFLCTLDSRYATITAEHRLAIRKADFPLKVVNLEEVNFLYTLRHKLTWGNDVRNF